MKTLLATIAILLSANLAAQDDQFKIKGFYAGMPLEEFEAVAESHGALFEVEGDGHPFFYFLKCVETMKEHNDRASERQEEPRSPTDLRLCKRYSSEPSNLTLAGFEVYSVRRYDASLFESTVNFVLPAVNEDKLLERLSKRYGEPDTLDKTSEYLDHARWLLDKLGDNEYWLHMSYYKKGVFVESETVRGSVTLEKTNPTAAEQYKQAKELEAQNDF